MEDHLNLGLKFAILPLKLDITQVLINFEAFERSILWTIFFTHKEETEDFIQPIFKTQKNNLPKKNTTPPQV